jgi:hypothetical protein
MAAPALRRRPLAVRDFDGTCHEVVIACGDVRPIWRSRH